MEKETLFDKTSSNCLYTASERSVDELYSPLEMGGPLKQQGLELSLQKNKESS